MTFTKKLALLSVFLLAACGKGGSGSGESGAITGADPICAKKLNLVENQSMNEVIIGDLRWSTTELLTDKAKKSNASSTAHLSIPARSSRCTGFLINDDTIMTNNHCVTKASDARGLVATFNYTKNNSGDKYSCNEFVMTNSGLDVALIKCKGNPGAKQSQVVLGGFKGEINDNIYITHQNCNYRTNSRCKPAQKYSEGKLLGSNAGQVEHNADTLPGSSGSPIFEAKSHKVVAIHNAGHNYGPNNGGMNYGIPMYKIVQYIQKRYPKVELNTTTDRAPAYSSCGQ